MRSHSLLRILDTHTLMTKEQRLIIRVYLALTALGLALAGLIYSIHTVI
jgi:hypothetical protein